jgi:molybdopterin synthase catalytic subunit
MKKKNNKPGKDRIVTDLNSLIAKIKKETDPAKVGMIVCHNGVVRGTTRSGQKAEFLDIEADWDAWRKVLAEMRAAPGIAAVEAYLFTGHKKVGDDVMLVAVAGDIRENVFPVLETTVNRLKKEAVRKKEGLSTV